MFWALKVHQQAVRYRMQTLWYNVMSKYTWYCGGMSTYILMIHCSTMYMEVICVT